jgi:signal transduction histidine kinase
MVLFLLISIIVSTNHEELLSIVCIILFFGIILYGAHAFGTLLGAVKRMNKGDLNVKADDKLLVGSFRDFAWELNSLADVAVTAAEKQLRSERMKTELITNVSHDIKTPLTSIINYVDLLQKTDDEGERREYLEVLDRQSQRLKKLIEDLMEMSRASSGNVAVEITPTDVGEAVNQALGEFADNLDRCGLTVLRRIPDEPCMALCDGRHLWRVLGNCLSNVVKYAMPGTRVYVDVEKRGQKVTVSLKNISANMLNVTAGELMERFVRGDTSRNTEGNGLGLNIAKSLMELQGGRLDLFVDGDLFKVVLSLSAPGE